MARWTTWCWAGAGRGAFGRWAIERGPCVRDVPPLVSLASVVSDVEQYHWPSLGAQCF